MSEQTNFHEPVSPDVVETQGTGTKRVNRLPIVICSGLAILFLGSVIYTGELRSMMNKSGAASPDTEKYKAATASLPPVMPPPGPDVSMPSIDSVAYNVQVPAQPGMPPQEADAVRMAREKKAAEMESAMKADSRIESFSSRQVSMNQPLTNSSQMASAGMPPPPPPKQPTGDGMDAMLGGSGAAPVRNHSGFGKNDDSSIYLPHTRESALSPYEIKAGSIIPGVMISGINSDLPGPIIGQVSANVYDSPTGRHLLIPAGAKLFGSYDSQVVAGEERVLIAWNRIIFPDGSSFKLNNMPGADQSGYAGFNDKVNNHYLRTFGNALMLSLLTAGMQIGQQPRGGVNGQLSATQIAAAASAMQFGMIGMQAARRGLNTPPTMEIRPGFLFNIMITQDMIMAPWRGHPMAQAAVNDGGSEDD